MTKTQKTEPKAAWIVGISGFWGQKIALSLFRLGWQVIGFSRSEPTLLIDWAEAQKKKFSWHRLDLNDPQIEDLSWLQTPQAYFHSAASFCEDRKSLWQINVTSTLDLMENVIDRMEISGSGRIGLWLGQNGRIGLPLISEFSATQGALWTWAEGKARSLRKKAGDLRLTLVFPPRAPSNLQANLASKLSKPPKVNVPENADDLVQSVLSGDASAGRLPLLASFNTALYRFF
ncbi:MAG: hypothetical protein SFT81_07830 [Candidatus Caenarcaniphilales bacterium]|nr:hypothetical protein [Candidatus Caenarcaniphilales bacterium]